MNYSFSDLKNISFNCDKFNNVDNYNFGQISKLAKNYISAKLPYASIRNANKAKILSKAHGVGEMSKNIISILSKNKDAKLALNMMLNNKYDQLKDKIREEGKSKGLSGRALNDYVRKQLKSNNLRRFG